MTVRTRLQGRGRGHPVRSFTRTPAHPRCGDWLREVVFGLNDGLVTTYSEGGGGEDASGLFSGPPKQHFALLYVLVREADSA
jgi:hypothetical protein